MVDCRSRRDHSFRLQVLIWARCRSVSLEAGYLPDLITQIQVSPARAVDAAVWALHGRCWPRGLQLELAGTGRDAWPLVFCVQIPAAQQHPCRRIPRAGRRYAVWHSLAEGRGLPIDCGLERYSCSGISDLCRSDLAPGAARFDQATTQTGISAGAEVQASTQTGSQTIGNCTEAQAAREFEGRAFCTETAQLALAGEGPGRIEFQGRRSVAQGHKDRRPQR